MEQYRDHIASYPEHQQRHGINDGLWKERHQRFTTWRRVAAMNNCHNIPPMQTQSLLDQPSSHASELNSPTIIEPRRHMRINGAYASPEGLKSFSNAFQHGHGDHRNHRHQQQHQAPNFFSSPQLNSPSCGFRSSPRQYYYPESSNQILPEQNGNHLSSIHGSLPTRTKAFRGHETIVHLPSSPPRCPIEVGPSHSFITPLILPSSHTSHKEDFGLKRKLSPSSVAEKVRTVFEESTSTELDVATALCSMSRNASVSQTRSAEKKRLSSFPSLRKDDLECRGKRRNNKYTDDDEEAVQAPNSSKRRKSQ